MCDVSFCAYPRTAYSRLCERHREVYRNHGHPLQTGVTKTELKPYRRAVKAYLRDRGGKNASTVLRKAWLAQVQVAEEFEAAVLLGKPHNKNERTAYLLVLDIAKEHDAADVAELLMAFGYWLQFEPRRFRSQDAFQFQVVRLFRRLNGVARYEFKPDGVTLKRTTYPRIPRKEAEAIWACSIAPLQFVEYGQLMCREVERARETKRRDTIAERAEVLGPLSTYSKELG